MMDTDAIRNDFPILERRINGRRMAFLDSAASSQKPVQVLDAMVDVYRNSYANVHRGAYTLSQEATEAYEEARHKVAVFLNATCDEEIIFTRSATAAMNLFAYGWGLNILKPGDRILTSVMEHHANIVPWHIIARHTGAELCYMELTDDYRLDMESARDRFDERVKVVAVSGMSNVLGTMPPVNEIARLAHEVGAVLLVDGAQLVPHAPVDVQTLGADFLGFSGHKMLGPTGIGVLWGRRELLESMEPAEGGGEMIRDVRLHESDWADVPHKFEAGTPPFVEAIGLGAAVDYLSAIGMHAVLEHDRDLTGYALERLAVVPGLSVQGPADTVDRGGAISFDLAGIHAHDVATILDQEGVAVRAGHHCAKPLLRSLGLTASARASFYVYNVAEDVDALVDALAVARRIFGLDSA
jgi:cysteine desulfurase/selenocysteine lyase